jgi:hypothetical protein
MSTIDTLENLNNRENNRDEYVRRYSLVCYKLWRMRLDHMLR